MSRRFSDSLQHKKLKLMKQFCRFFRCSKFLPFCDKGPLNVLTVTTFLKCKGKTISIVDMCSFLNLNIRATLLQGMIQLKVFLNLFQFSVTQKHALSRTPCLISRTTQTSKAWRLQVLDSRPSLRMVH